jgi:hypothetical protein
MVLREGGKGNENDRASTTLSNKISMKVEDIRVYIESY